MESFNESLLKTNIWKILNLDFSTDALVQADSYYIERFGRNLNEIPTELIKSIDYQEVYPDDMYEIYKLFKIKSEDIHYFWLTKLYYLMPLPKYWVRKKNTMETYHYIYRDSYEQKYSPCLNFIYQQLLFHKKNPEILKAQIRAIDYIHAYREYNGVISRTNLKIYFDKRDKDYNYEDRNKRAKKEAQSELDFKKKRNTTSTEGILQQNFFNKSLFYSGRENNENSRNSQLKNTLKYKAAALPFGYTTDNSLRSSKQFNKIYEKQQIIGVTEDWSKLKSVMESKSININEHSNYNSHMDLRGEKMTYSPQIMQKQKRHLRISSPVGRQSTSEKFNAQPLSSKSQMQKTFTSGMNQKYRSPQSKMDNKLFPFSNYKPREKEAKNTVSHTTANSLRQSASTVNNSFSIRNTDYENRRNIFSLTESQDNKSFSRKINNAMTEMEPTLEDINADSIQLSNIEEQRQSEHPGDIESNFEININNLDVDEIKNEGNSDQGLQEEEILKHPNPKTQIYDQTIEIENGYKSKNSVNPFSFITTNEKQTNKITTLKIEKTRRLNDRHRIQANNNDDTQENTGLGVSINNTPQKAFPLEPIADPTEKRKSFTSDLKNLKKTDTSISTYYKKRPANTSKFIVKSNKILNREDQRAQAEIETIKNTFSKYGLTISTKSLKRALICPRIPIPDIKDVKLPKPGSSLLNLRHFYASDLIKKTKKSKK